MEAYDNMKSSPSPALQKRSRRPATLVREEIEVSLGLIEAATWPARHRVHKYWGRKPANVVSRYIEVFTRPGDTVLDLFCGSAVTVVEAALLKRDAIGIDNNAVAVELARSLICPVAPEVFRETADEIMALVEEAFGHLHTTTCTSCGERVVVRSYGWVEATLHAVRYRCPRCGKREASPRQDDLLLAHQCERPLSAPDADIHFGWQMLKLKRAGAKRWSDLFTPRNLTVANALREQIAQVPDPATRRWLEVTLSSSLAQFTKMIAESSGSAGGPSWKLNSYWLPRRWQELNPLHYFNNRVRKSEAALRELFPNASPLRLARVECGDSRSLNLPSDSIDYIFTDPPYGGEGIQYGELSMLWSLWLGLESRLETEIAFNPYRGFTHKTYSSRLEEAFAEAARVLKPTGWMTVTFANKDPKVWDGLMHACKRAGLSLVTAAPMKRSAPSLTETTAHRAPKADLVLTFRPGRALSPQHRQPRTTDPNYPLMARVEAIAKRLLDDGEPVAPHHLFDMITIDWFSWFYEIGERPVALQPNLDNVEAALMTLGYWRRPASSRGRKPDPCREDSPQRPASDDADH